MNATQTHRSVSYVEVAHDKIIVSSTVETPTKSSLVPLATTMFAMQRMQQTKGAEMRLD